jgi:hypothetical protein
MMATQGDSARGLSASPAGVSQGTLVEYEEFIEAQLRKTRGHVRSVDLAGTLMTLAAGTLAFFFLAGLIDHWVVPGGLGFWGRLALLCAYLAGASVYLARQVLPLLVRRINPLYAAQTIERSRPSLKNAIVNFLLFRADHSALPRMVYEAIEEQAAVNLAKVHVETAVDRSKLIRIGYVLVAVLVACAVYTLFSPKDLFRTAGRVVMPWASIDPPTRTAILEVEPGDTPAFRGQQLTIKARIEGLADRGAVRLVYSTDDGQVVDRPLEMSLPLGGYKHVGMLPAGDATLQQSVTYRIEAGDAATRLFRVEVSPAPAIAVRSVEYKYPSYTGLLAQRVDDQPDIKAIEGTEITIHAIANEEIQSAHVDFDCDDKVDQRMQVDKTLATATFTASLKADRSAAAYHSYQLIFKNAEGQQNPQPVRHQIEVTRDLPPEIQFVAPKDAEIDLPLDGAVDLEIVANDPDFGLRTVKLSMTPGKHPVVEKVLLDESWRGQWVKKLHFQPGKLNLKPGDVIEYSALAEDNKSPNPNRAETSLRRIRVVSPQRRPPKNDQVAKGDRRGEGHQQRSDRENGPDAADQTQANDDQQNQKGQKPKPDQRVADNRANKQEDQQDKQDGAADPADRQPADGQSETAKQGEQASENGKSGEKTNSKDGAQSPTSRDEGDNREKNPADEHVANDGSNDSEAIERILEHQQEKDPAKPQPDKKDSQTSQGGQQKSGGGDEPGEAQKDAGKQSGQEGKSGDEGGQPGGKDAGQKNGNDGGQSAGQNNQNQDDGQPRTDESGESSKPAGGESRGQKGGQSGSEKDPQTGNQPGQQKEPGGGDRSQSDKNDGQRPPKDSKDSSDGVKKPADPSAGKDRQPAQEPRPGEQADGGDGQPQPPDKSPATKGDKSQREQQDKRQSGARPADEEQGESGGAAGRDQAKSQDPSQKPSQGQEPGQGQAEDAKSGAGADSAKTDGKQGKPENSKQGKQDSGAPGQQKDSKGQDGENNKPGEKQDGAKDGSQDAGQPNRTGEKPEAKPSGEKGTGKSNDTGSKSTEKGSKETSADKRDKSDAAQTASDEKEKGPSGQGQAGQENKGSPEAQGQNQPRSKSSSGTSRQEDRPQANGAQSPSTSDKQSDSEGRDDGDRSGGGKQGGGQKAKKPGNGGAGESTPADEGAGRAEEPGEGETSAGEQGSKPSAEKTGKSGSAAGKGSADAATDDKSSPSESDGPPSGEPQQDDALRPGDKVRSGAPGSQIANGPAPEKPPAKSSGERPFRPASDVADEANLEYARKATDLAISHLKDELKKDKPDPALLERLGWSKADLEKFVSRWEQMRGQARESGSKGAAARRELDDSLRSLGLRPRATSLKSNAARDDKSQGYKESRRTSPPPEYAEQYKAYTQGTAKGSR